MIVRNQNVAENEKKKKCKIYAKAREVRDKNVNMLSIKNTHIIYILRYVAIERGEGKKKQLKKCLPIQCDANHAKQRKGNIRIEYDRKHFAECVSHCPGLYECKKFNM